MKYAQSLNPFESIVKLVTGYQSQIGVITKQDSPLWDKSP